MTLPREAVWLQGLLLCITCSAQCVTRPFCVEADALFDSSQPATLGLSRAPDMETFTVFRATGGEHQYNHGAALTSFHGTLYLQWQSSAVDEDEPGTEVLYATSSDAGMHWSKPVTLAPARDNAIVTSGGWHAHGDRLVAYLNVWPADLSPRGGYVECITSADGFRWSEPEPVITASGEPLLGIIEQDIRALSTGRLLTAVHQQPGLILAPCYTDDPLGITGWTIGEMENLDHKSDISREIEPSWFQRADGVLVMVFRDQASSFRILASESSDKGGHWTLPTITSFPDSRAKQCAGNLPGGAAYIVNNPSGNKQRVPLVITLSADGIDFNRAYCLRAGGEELPLMRHRGRHKSRGYSYPKSYVETDYLYIAYATNKEDIEVTRIPVASLQKELTP